MSKRKFAVGDVVKWESYGDTVYGVVMWHGKVGLRIRYQILSSDLFGAYTSGRFFNKHAHELAHARTFTGAHRRNHKLVRQYNEGMYG